MNDTFMLGADRMTRLCNPLEQLGVWIAEERSLGNPFAHGAVLGTQGEDRMPHTRMLGVSFNRQKMPKFHTSPTSRKVQDLSCHHAASLTFAFQQSMRSISLEGFLTPLSDEELSADWKTLDPEFRSNYLVFGPRSGAKIDSLQELHLHRDAIVAETKAAPTEKLRQLLSNAAAENSPPSFIGYKFETVQRIAFYSVAAKDFARCEVYEFNPATQGWIYSLRVP
jgi:pyridoxine/pyridoxamine 5'-phosphate oxidase